MAGLLGNIQGALSDPQFRDDVTARARRFAMIPEQSPYGAGGIPTEQALATMPRIGGMENNDDQFSRDGAVLLFALAPVLIFAFGIAMLLLWII